MDPQTHQPQPHPRKVPKALMFESINSKGQSTLKAYLLHPVHSQELRTRSGALPSRHTIPCQPSPLSEYQSTKVLAECGYMKTYRHSRPHKRPSFISVIEKENWYESRRYVLKYGPGWDATTPRVLTLSSRRERRRNALAPCLGTRAVSLGSHQGVLGLNTSHGSKRFRKMLLSSRMNGVLGVS